MKTIYRAVTSDRTTRRTRASSARLRTGGATFGGMLARLGLASQRLGRARPRATR